MAVPTRAPTRDDEYTPAAVATTRLLWGFEFSCYWYCCIVVTSPREPRRKWRCYGGCRRGEAIRLDTHRLVHCKTPTRTHCRYACEAHGAVKLTCGAGGLPLHGHGLRAQQRGHDLRWPRHNWGTYIREMQHAQRCVPGRRCQPCDEHPELSRLPPPGSAARVSSTLSAAATTFLWSTAPAS